MTVSYNNNQLLPLQLEIESIMDDCQFDDSGYSVNMKDFADRIGLVSVWDKFDIDYTHIHTDLKSTLTLDHSLVNKRLLEKITAAGPIHLGDNLS